MFCDYDWDDDDIADEDPVGRKHFGAGIDNCI